MKVSGIVLAGGRSLRFGRNKVVEQLSGKTLVQRVLENLKPLVEQFLVVTSQEMASLSFPEGTEVLVDKYPGKGPLSGIYTGLSAAKYEHSIVVGCDMPLLNRGLLQYLMEQAQGKDVVVPRLNSQVEPLHAVYAKSCLTVIKEHLDQGQLEIRALYSRLNIHYVEAEECRILDPEMLSFININNQNDLEKVARLLLLGWGVDD